MQLIGSSAVPDSLHPGGADGSRAPQPGSDTPAPRPAHPVLAIVDKVLQEMGEPPVGAEWSWRATEGTRLVNGLAVPVRRVSWSKIGPFFEQVYDSANAALFRRRLPGCRLRWNRRFRNLAGRIHLRERILELSSAHFEACGAVALGVVLVHEQIHLALYESGLPAGHTRQFKRLSCSFGLPATHHELPLPDRLRRKVLHLYRCVCGSVVESRVRFQKPRACAACCEAFAGGRFDPRFLLQYLGPKTEAA